jgi:2-polyprenyl-3-methyl-5-hydroxy-6-metoxy-1,4-benzoquinol methylase
VSKQFAVQPENKTGEFVWQERERTRFKVTRRCSENPLVMPEWNIPRCERRGEDTVFPIEYAFHLLGDVRGKTVVDLGCGDGLNTIILASLGATVLSVDISVKSLELTRKRAIANGVAGRVALLHSDAAAIPIDAGTADAVFGAAILHHVDPIRAARQIRRVLKPGGVAVFQETIVRPSSLAAMKNGEFGPDERALTLAEIQAVCRAVGIAGRHRPFWLTTGFVCSFGAGTFSLPAKAAQRLDALVLRRFPFVSRFASRLVWEAHKES